jgi:RHS repeat-associated protein
MKIHVFIFLLLATVRLQAQWEIPTAVNNQNRAGDLPFSTSIGSANESVDIGSGNLTFTLPIASLPGRGLPYNFQLRFSGLMWITSVRQIAGAPTATWTAEKRPYLYFNGIPAWGWQANDRLLTWTTFKEQCGYFGAGQPPTYRYIATGYLYQDESGNKHQIGNQSTYSPADCAEPETWTGELEAPDVGISDMFGKLPDHQHTPAIYLSNGTQVAWPVSNELVLYHPPDIPPSSAPSETMDRNGNTVGNGVGSADTLGRIPVTSVTGTNFIAYKVYDANGTQQTYTVYFGPISTSTSFNATHQFYGPIQEGGCPNCYKVTAITLPNGTSYFFQYDSYGLITRIDLPTGGYVTYSWSNFSDREQSYRYVSNRTVVNNGVLRSWSFTRICVITDVPCARVQVTATDPEGVQSRYEVSNGNLLSAKFYTSTVGSAILKQVDICYTPSCPATTFAASQPYSVTTTLEDGTSSRSVFTYLGWDPTTGFLNHSVREIKEFAFNAGPTDAPVRRIYKQYLHRDHPDANTRAAYISRNFVGEVIRETIYNSANSVVADTKYTYDDYSGFSAFAPSATAPWHEAAGHGSSFTYRANITKVSRWRNKSANATITNDWLDTLYQYDILGNIRAIKDPGGHVTTWDYVDSWYGSGCNVAANSQAFPSDAKNALNQHIVRSFYPCTGQVRERKDQNDINAGRSGTLFTYDFMNRPNVTTFPDGGETDLDYDDVNRWVRTKQLRTTGNYNVSYSRFDDMGRTWRTEFCEDGSTACTASIKTDTTYEALGRVSTVSNPFRATTDPTYGVTANTYDALGRVTRVTHPDGNYVGTAYAGPCSTTTDESGRSRKTCTDALGRLKNVVEDPGGLTYNTQYSYDVLGNLLCVEQRGDAATSTANCNNPVDGIVGDNWRVRKFTYNSLSQLLTAHNPESGLISYSYDGEGNVAVKTAPAPNQTGAATVTTSHTYDDLHRLRARSFSDGTQTENFLYDYYPTLPSANAIGRLLVHWTNNTQTSYTFDVMGRITGANQIAPSNVTGPAYSVSATYDLAGNNTSLTYPSGRKVTFNVDTASRLSNVVFSGLGVATANYSYYQPNLYTPHGAITLATFGNGLLESTAYNYRLQPAVIELAPFSAPTNRLLYRAHNYIDGNGKNNGNIINISDFLNSGRTQSFTYDSLNRIASAYTTATAGADAWGTNYTIDAWGNLTMAVKPGSPGGESFAYSAGTNNRTNGYCFDSAGNLLKQAACPAVLTTAPFQYDAANRLRGTANNTYTYDVNGNRVRKHTDANNYTEYIFFGTNVVAEKQVTAGGAPVWTDYIFAGGKRIARVPVGASVSADWANTEFYHADHLGSATLMTNVGGTIVANSFTTYLPFGQEWNPQTTTNHYKFTSKERDAESGLDYFGARYYGSPMGRWMTPDWSTSPATVPYANFVDPQTLNLYGYIRNTPLAHEDANGHCCSAGEMADWLVEKARVAQDFYNDMAVNSGNAELSQAVTMTTGMTKDVLDIAVDPLRAGNAVGECFDSCTRVEMSDAVSTDLLRTSTIISAGASAAPKPASLPARLPQDLSVNPAPPAALPTNRPVGTSATQNAAAQADIAAARAAGAIDIRVNQQQVNAQGARCGICRPDVQYTDAAGNRIYIEYERSGSNRGAAHKQRLEANDPRGKVIVKRND